MGMMDGIFTRFKILKVTAPLIPLGHSAHATPPDHQVVQHGRQFFFLEL